MRRLWWLNLDAERELDEPSARTTSRKLRSQMAERLEHFAAALCQGEPFLTSADPTFGRIRSELDEETRVLPWCPTPGARQAIARAGLIPPDAPALPVLQRVNDRAFALQLSRSPELGELGGRLDTLYPATLAFETARHIELGSPPAVASTFPGEARLKRRYGFAGKGQRRLVAWPEPVPTAETQRWLEGARRGFLLEPDVEVELEASLHGLVTERELLLGTPCLLYTDEFGAPLEVVLAPPGHLPELFDACLGEAAEFVGRALRREGYFGPFGFDARLFRWRGARGATLLGDLNARFTLGWSTGMADLRDRALELLIERSYPTRVNRNESLESRDRSHPPDAAR